MAKKTTRQMKPIHLNQIILCKHRFYPEQCPYCRIEYWKKHPATLVSAGDLLFLLNHVLDRCDDLSDKIEDMQHPQ